VLGDCI